MKPKVIVGPNASGKTKLAESVLKEYAGKYSWSKVRYLAFRDSYGLSDSGYYMQQRWNACDCDLIPTVFEALGQYQSSAFQKEIFGMFNVEALMDKLLVQLSSGELRKYQIVKALSRNPKVLAMDNPFIGLDTSAREQLSDIIRRLTEFDALEILLIVSREEDIPEYAGEIIRTDETAEALNGISTKEACRRVESLPDNEIDYQNAVLLKDVTIRFGEHTLLSHLDWTVKAGEKWALEGPNGSGKSTLLSIICADIPQAYACDVTLFDRRRGSGETIWDIKKHIGSVSPELHRAFQKNVPVLDIVASGLHDRQGMYVKTPEESIPQCRFWLEVFAVGDKEQRPFLSLSSGEQRLVLLARAFVKDPDLLILDEPFTGLDNRNASRVRAIIESFCSRPGKTFIMVSHYPQEFPGCITHHLRLTRS